MNAPLPPPSPPPSISSAPARPENSRRFLKRNRPFPEAGSRPGRGAGSADLRVTEALLCSSRRLGFACSTEKGIWPCCATTGAAASASIPRPIPMVRETVGRRPSTCHLLLLPGREALYGLQDAWGPAGAPAQHPSVPGLLWLGRLSASPGPTWFQPPPPPPSPTPYSSEIWKETLGPSPLNLRGEAEASETALSSLCGSPGDSRLDLCGVQRPGGRARE